MVPGSVGFCSVVIRADETKRQRLTVAGSSDIRAVRGQVRGKYVQQEYNRKYSRRSSSVGDRDLPWDLLV